MVVLLPNSCHITDLPCIRKGYSFSQKSHNFFHSIPLKGRYRIHGSSDKFDTPTFVEDKKEEVDELKIDNTEEERVSEKNLSATSTSTTAAAAPAIEKDLKKVVNKTAATFAPRASTATKNPAVPGSTLYTVFEVQGYASMLLGGVLSFNLVFPSNEPDIWRLMGMWSIWMFTIPSLRARDCSNKEKEALNYLFS
ncbi:hypothetical protein RDABS01_025077 [Bienertia sinuspersici]